MQTVQYKGKTYHTWYNPSGFTPEDERHLEEFTSSNFMASSPFYPCIDFKHWAHLNVGEVTYGYNSYVPPDNRETRYRRIIRVM